MGWLAAIGNAIKLGLMVLGWAKQSSDEKTGRDLQSGEDAKANVEVKNVQLEASVDRPRDRDDLIARLRSHRDAD